MNRYSAICEGLAKKYWPRDGSQYDDLRQEGLLAIYEEVDKHAELIEDVRAIQVANEAMWEYINLRELPVSMPDIWEVKALLRGNTEWIEKYSQYRISTLDWMRLVLEAKDAGFEEGLDELESKNVKDSDTALALEVVWSVASQVLSPRDYMIFCYTYKDEMSSAEIADRLDLTRQATDRLIELATERVRKGLSNRKFTRKSTL
jgi:DNA-directed RNA polymerase specialized sigma subunit